MNMFQSLWCDEAGAILSAELVMVGTLAVVGSVVGLGAAAGAVNDELHQFSSSIRRLDQSYIIKGHSGCRAWTAGSYYIQPVVSDEAETTCGSQTPEELQQTVEQIDAQRSAVMPVAPAPAAPAGEAAATDAPAQPKKKKDKKKNKDKKDRDEQSAVEAPVSALDA